MPRGNTDAQVRWFSGWYEEVIGPAVVESGYRAILSATEEQPGAINDEIRSHLAFDPMVVIDLAGFGREDPPNPNVMYELGIRHAFDLPLVMMAWDGQNLPFDVGNQRAIMCTRDFLNIRPTRDKLVAFIHAASEGRYYRPMEAVGRQAQIDMASSALGEDALLRALTDELRDIKKKLPIKRDSAVRRRIRGSQVRHFLSKRAKGEIRQELLRRGMNTRHWEQVLDVAVPFDLAHEARMWDLEEWKDYLFIMSQRLLASGEQMAALPRRTSPRHLDPEFIEQVDRLLPKQPWTKGVHKMIAAALGSSNLKVSNAINELVRTGRYLPQIDGTVYEPRNAANADTAVELASGCNPGSTPMELRTEDTKPGIDVGPNPQNSL